ncbi:MAG: hypothetical protein HYY35_08520 [Deltaproteobacteria bacterium]|nr:hypothetical protein [Deltaproteobacteria bacterium]
MKSMRTILGKRSGWLAIIAVLGFAALARAQTYETLSEFRAGGGEALIGPVDQSVTGYFSAVERFSFVNLSPELRALSSGTVAFPAFRQFAEEARATIDGVPFPSGSTSVAYTYDEKLETWVRWQRPLAPSLSQNARTNGRHVLTIGAAYSYVDYTKFDDSPLRRTAFSAGDIPVVFGDGSTGVARDILLSEISLREHIGTVSVQLGVLDNLDVGVFIPMAALHFRGAAIDRFFLESRAADGSTRLTPADVFTLQGRCCVFQADPNVPTYGGVSSVDRRAYSDVSFPGIRYGKDEIGIGDVQVRAKYFIGSAGPIDAGLLLNVLTPTGDEEELLGVGAWRFQPRVILSTSQSRFAAHVNLGFNADAEDQDRDRFDYSVGAEVQLLPRVALLVDQVARLEYFGEDQVRKFEIVPGLKINVVRDLVIGFNAIVPLNREGLTTNFTPNVLMDASVVF